MTLNGWAWMAFIALCAFSLMGLLHGMRPGIFRGTASKMMVSICFLSFLTAGAGIAVQYQTLDRGVITGKNARLRVSPFDSANDSGLIKNGKVVQLANTYAGYVFVKEANGKSGWIAESEVKAILPFNGNHQNRTSLTQATIRKVHEDGGESKMNKT